MNTNVSLMYYGFFPFPTFTVSNRYFFQNIGVGRFFFADVVYMLQDLWSTSMQTHSSSAQKRPEKYFHISSPLGTGGSVSLGHLWSSRWRHWYGDWKQTNTDRRSHASGWRPLGLTQSPALQVHSSLWRMHGSFPSREFFAYSPLGALCARTSL